MQSVQVPTSNKATTHLDVPNVPDLLLVALGMLDVTLDHILLLNGVVHGHHAVSGALQLEALLVRKVQQTDETEARADFLHLVARIRPLQARDDLTELPRLGGVCRCDLVVVYLLYRKNEIS